MENLRPQLVESMKASLQDLLHRLHQEKEAISAKIAQVEQNLSALGANTPFGITGKKRRALRGANRDSVKNELLKNPAKKFTVGELAEIIDIPRSSVRAVLKKLTDQGFAQENPKGLWKKTATSDVE